MEDTTGLLLELIVDIVAILIILLIGWAIVTAPIPPEDE